MFVELVLEVEKAHVAAISDALLEAGALAATIEDADAGTPSEVPLFDEPGEIPGAAWPTSRVIALIDGPDAAESVIAQLARTTPADSFRMLARRSVEAQDWVRATQAQFDPIAIGERLWIVPSWHELPATPGQNAVLIRLDPGLAFGTGSHPTTRLCLRWLEANVKAGQSVIDFGCGSGILAIAAKKLGAARVVGTDIDPQAVSAAHANARDNQCEIEFTESARFTSPRAHIVVANILSNPLKLLAPALCDLVAPGGALVLSGILERQSEELIEAYQSWIALSVWAREDGWVCLAGARREVAS